MSRPIRSMIPGPHLISGDSENLWLGNPKFETSVGVIAKAGGGQSTATLIASPLSAVDTVATAADSVKLPPAVEGTEIVLTNRGAASMQVFGSGSDTINGVATATGVAQGNGLTAVYYAVRSQNSSLGIVGQWVRLLSA